jgi:hypothetical protein
MLARSGQLGFQIDNQASVIIAPGGPPLNALMRMAVPDDRHLRRQLRWFDGAFWHRTSTIRSRS